LSADAGRVTGVRTADGGVLPADLVVDATGRTSRLPDWLAGIGLPAPAEEVVDARIGYASRLYRADRSWFAGAGMFVLATPETGTGGSVLPVEGGRWLVAAVGVGDRRPARDQAGFHAFLAGLRDPALAEFVSVADPAGPISWYRRTANRRRRYERMRAWPAGLLVLGDALCAFNPIYGQGITVAALQAIALAAVPAGAERALLRRFARLAALPWTIATGEDLRFPTARGRQNVVQAQFGRYARALDRLATHGDVDARRATAAVYQLMASPARLLHPRLVTATARAALRGYGDPVPRPAVLDRQHARSRGE
jgi:flavin-dependent dehydrogenase